MLARLLDRPKFFSTKVVTSRDTVCHNNYVPIHLSKSGKQTPDSPNPDTVMVASIETLNYYPGNQLTEELARDYLDSIGDNSFYALKYTVAEILCLVTSILQIVLTNQVTTERNILMVTLKSLLSPLTVPQQ